MLRFRMKMLSKENLIARTSDIGFCLGLLVGKILSVGFVIGAFSANAMDHPDMKKTRSANEARGLGNKALQERDEYKRQLHEYKRQLQEQLSKQSASSSEEDVSERNSLLSERNALLSEKNALQEKLD